MRKSRWIVWLMVWCLPISAARAQSDAQSQSGSESAEPVDLKTPDKESNSSSSTPESGSEPGCSYHVDCPSDHVCWRGSCVRTSRAMEIMSSASANDQCGADRRCRIERLKRKNRARRQARKLQEERYVENLVDKKQKKQLQEKPRHHKPLGVNLRASRLGVVGLVAGYTLLGRLRPELHFVHWPADVYVQHNDRDFSGFQPTTFLIPGLYYFFLDTPFSPYASASFLYGWGNYQNDSFGVGPREGGPSGPGQLDTEYHALELGAGLDYQIKKLGAHFRLGLTYRPLIYNQARIAPGRYHKPTRGALEKWFKQMVQVDVIFLAGWAF
ncbi:MAG: hypothetical protein ABEN55_02590 [Bradymonadaceae bacterium]